MGSVGLLEGSVLIGLPLYVFSKFPNLGPFRTPLFRRTIERNITFASIASNCCLLD